MGGRVGSWVVAAASLLGCGLFAQSTTTLRFETASVKPNLEPIPAATTGSVVPYPGRLVARAALLRFVIQQAYEVRRDQVVGGPDWINTARFDIEARADGNTTFPQLFLMLQSLLEDRFRLRAHRETRQLPVYELTVAKGGSKLQKLKPGGCFALPLNGPPVPPPPGPGAPPPCGRVFVGMFNGKANLEGGNVPVAELVRVLSNMLGRTVIDKTGMSGTYDIHLPFAPDAALQGLPGVGAPGDPVLPVSADPAAGATIFTAIQEELGLRLESTKGPVDVVIIDHAEKPSEN